MCGITGFINPDYTTERAQDLLHTMGLEILHRGPDDSGTWFDQTTGVGLSHRRLSIFDLSPDGHQPMKSSSGRFTMVYNGEVYNFQSIKRELTSAGYQFRSHSDTEVILNSFEQWGVHESLKKFIGMFAIAAWDNKEKRLYLCRDRMGEKPLYFGQVAGKWVFSSELKPLKVLPNWTGEINRDALAQLLQLNYIPAPNTIYKNIHKVKPGHVVELIQRGDTFDCQEQSYWSLADKAQQGINNQFADYNQAKSELHNTLRDAVHLQMQADVPLGAFLSGGIDSSAIVGIMQSMTDKQVQSFTIGFYEEAFNEAEHAKAVAKHIGTDHTEIYITADETRDVISLLPTLYDEPFSDVSQIPTYLVSKVARSKVTVSLSGDAGDELFFGYHRYFLAQQLWNKISKLPSAVRIALAKTLQLTPEALLKLPLLLVKPFIPQRYTNSSPLDKLLKLGNLLDTKDQRQNFQNLVYFYRRPESLVLGASSSTNEYENDELWNIPKDYFSQMALTDSLTYLPDDILVKVDRASMGVSLETRAPFLDHRVVETAWKLPPEFKTKDGVGKTILRDILYEYVPRDLVERPKMGFGVPIGLWLRRELRDWGETLLDEGKLRDQGYFDVKKIRKIWQDHVSGERDWQDHLWSILMFQAWLENN